MEIINAYISTCSLTGTSQHIVSRPKIFLKKRLDKPQPSFPPVSPLMTVNCRSDSFSSDLQNLVTIAIDLQRKNKQLNCAQLCNFSLQTRVMSTQEGTTFCHNEIV